MDKLVWRKEAVDGYNLIAEVHPDAIDAIDDALDLIEEDADKAAKNSNMYTEPIPLLLMRVHPRKSTVLAFFIAWRRIPGGSEVVHIQAIFE